MESQQLNVNLLIQIPSDLVVITKVDLEELKRQELSGVYWNMKELERRTGKKAEWIKENILFPTKFRKVLDVEHGGFVFYPKSKGQTWSFQANKMAAFLDKNFNCIFKSK
jgi:phage pi2 protein 07